MSVNESIPVDEQETVINIDYLDGIAYVYSNNKPMMRRLEKMKTEYEDEVSVEKQDASCIMVKVPVDWIKIRPKIKREMTEEQKEKMREVARIARSAIRR